MGRLTAGQEEEGRRSVATWLSGRAVGTFLALSAALTACTGSDDPDPEPTSSPPPLVVVDLEFGVWGTDEEVAAYRDVVASN